MNRHHHTPLHVQRWSEDQTLHVAIAYANPFRWRSRTRLFHDCVQHLTNQANVELHIGEAAYGDRPFEVTDENNPNHVQLRVNSELFHKENILNEVIHRFPHTARYGAYVDADFTFTRHDWALEAIHQLQHSPWVQLFSQYGNLNSDHSTSDVRKSFARTYIDNGHALPEQGYSPGGWAGNGVYIDPVTPAKSVWVPVGATGGAWAFTMQAFQAAGGLMDHCILGHADWFMAFGLVSQPTRGTIAESKYHPNYKAMIEAWQNRAVQFNQNIGVVNQFAVHHYHGPMKNRGYGSRDQLLVQHNFDPIADLFKNKHGLYELAPHKPVLRDAIRRYFISRSEDDNK